MIVLGLFLVAEAQLTEGVVPAVRPLDDPPPGWVAARGRGRWWGWRARLALVGRVDEIAPCLGGPADTFGRLNTPLSCISTTNRNFPGRMGHKEARVYLASPLTR